MTAQKFDLQKYLETVSKGVCPICNTAGLIFEAESTEDQEMEGSAKCPKCYKIIMDVYAIAPNETIRGK